jgi:protein-cysteine N-palmitoyltransferase HHAT
VYRRPHIKLLIFKSTESDPRYSKFASKLSPGWIPGRKVDNSDQQYSNFRDNLPILFVVVLLHPYLRKFYDFVTRQSSSQVSSRSQQEAHATPISPKEADANLKQRVSFDLLFAIIFITALHGISAAKILLILYLNFNISKKTPRKYVPAAIWTFNLATLFANELAKGYRLKWIVWKLTPLIGSHEALSAWAGWLDGYGGLNSRWEVLFNFTTLRMISFSMDYYWSLKYGGNSAIEVCSTFADRILDDTKKQKKKQLDPADLSERDRIALPNKPQDYSLRNYIAYCLYSPLYLAGPIITFNDYTSQNKYPAMTVNSSRVIVYGLRFVISLLCMEVILHFIYCVAISKSNPEWASYTPYQISMLSYFNLNIVWLKLLLPWRFFRLWALMDGIDPPENMVRCMNDNYSALAFWRGWHRSFNRWIIRYIYIPLGGNGNRGQRGRFDAVRTVINYLAVFTFVALWHDISLHLLVWGWLITVFIVPEVLAKFLFPERRWKDYPDTYRFLKGIGGASNIIMMMVANLVGFCVGIDGIKVMLATLFGSTGGKILSLLNLVSLVKSN